MISPRRCTQPLGSPSTSAQRTHRMTGEPLLEIGMTDSVRQLPAICLCSSFDKLIHYIVVFLSARHINTDCSDINQSCTIEMDSADTSTCRCRE